MLTVDAAPSRAAKQPSRRRTPASHFGAATVWARGGLADGHRVEHRGPRATAASAPSSPDTLRTIGGGPVFVSIDVDVLDPA
jgi:hypothetical protein